MRELVCFAAVLGYQVNRRVALTGATEEVDGRIMERSDAAVDLVNLVALCETREIDALLPEREEEAIKLFEEYAAGGLDEIRAWLAERPDDERGDQAIIVGLQSRGLLGDDEPGVDDVLATVTF
jgi:dnd system-associated protein 4